MNIKLGLGAALLGASLLVGGAANAATTFFFAETSADGVKLSASLSFALSGTSGTTYIYDVELSNTTFDQAGKNTLGSFGINVNPDGVEFGSISNSFYSLVGAVGNVGEELGGFEFCFENDSNDNCTGNKTNLPLGEGDTDQFTLSFVSDRELDFINAFVRFQGVGDSGGSAKIGNCIGVDCGGGGGIGGEVPLPAGLPLILTGLGVFGAMRMRKSKKA